MLESIFDHLSLEEVKKARLVCKTWRTIIDGGVWWKWTYEEKVKASTTTIGLPRIDLGWSLLWFQNHHQFRLKNKSWIDLANFFGWNTSASIFMKSCDPFYRRTCLERRSQMSVSGEVKTWTDADFDGFPFLPRRSFELFGPAIERSPVSMLTQICNRPIGC